MDMQDGLLDEKIWKELLTDCDLQPCERPQVRRLLDLSFPDCQKCCTFRCVQYMSCGPVMPCMWPFSALATADLSCSRASAISSKHNLVMRFHQRLAAVQATLYHQLGMTKADFSKIVDTRRSNGLLQLRVPTIQTKFRFFKDELSLSDEDIRKLLVKCPRVMEHKVESTMRPHLEFLQQQGVAKEDLGKVGPSCNHYALTCLTQQPIHKRLLLHARFDYAPLPGFPSLPSSPPSFQRLHSSSK